MTNTTNTSISIPFNKGSTKRFSVIFKIANGLPRDLSGYSVQVYDTSSAEVDSKVSLTITDALNGVVSGVIVDSNLLREKKVEYFRILFLPLSGNLPDPLSTEYIFLDKS